VRLSVCVLSYFVCFVYASPMCGEGLLLDSLYVINMISPESRYEDMWEASTLSLRGQEHILSKA